MIRLDISCMSQLASFSFLSCLILPWSPRWFLWLISLRLSFVEVGEGCYNLVLGKCLYARYWLASPPNILVVRLCFSSVAWDSTNPFQSVWFKEFIVDLWKFFALLSHDNGPLLSKLT